MKNIEQIIKDIEKKGKAIGFKQTSDRKMGALLATLSASKPKSTFLELGTGCGLSTVWMASGMDDSSTLISVDNDEEVIAIAKEYLYHDKRITFVCNQGESVIDTIETSSVDLIFADTWPGKYHYLEETLALLKVGGIYMIDDMLPQDNWPDGHEKKVESLIKTLNERADLFVVEMHWASGVILCTKKEIVEKETNEWNAIQYNKHADFVSALCLPVVEFLAPKKNEKILDLGCGDGTLAIEIEKSGANVIAVDLSEDMVKKAKEKGIETYVMSTTQLNFEDEFDAVFSNAVLHWVKDSEEAVKNIHKVLRKGGSFVAEFGGYGNVHYIVKAMRKVFSNHPEYGTFDNPWFFPTAEKYAETLNKYGFDVEYIELIPRPTPIDDISNWLAIFTNGITEHLSEEQKLQFRLEVREVLKEKIYTKEEGWVADYVRLRVKAVKLI